MVKGQIFTQNSTNGSITITPKGLDGNTNNGYDYSSVALGSNALKNSLKSFHNTAIGYFTLFSNTYGTSNTALGSSALRSNTTGNYNTANGFQALYSNITGSSNTAFGYHTLFNTTTGNYNTANGLQALYLNTTGTSNTAFGSSALFSNMTGNHNTAIGKDALYNSTGYYNTAIGTGSGIGILSGNYNTFLGYGSDVTAATFTNATAIGANAIVNASNKVRIGNASVTIVEGPVAYTYPSDRRLKEGIIYTHRLGLDFISKLQTVSYNYVADKAKTRYDGFIAQDIEQVIKDLNVPFSGLKKSDDGMYSLAYSDFVMPLVNAVNELNKQNKILEKRLSALEELKTELANLKAESKIRNSAKK